MNSPNIQKDPNVEAQKHNKEKKIEVYYKPWIR